MLQVINVNNVTVWSGEGRLSSKDTLTCNSSRFETFGVTTSDVLEIARKSDEGVDPDWQRIPILQVNGEFELVVGQSDLAGDVVVRVSRPLSAPCRVCVKSGTPRESDHLHCVRCRAEVELGWITVHCTACLDYARKKLAKSNIFSEEFSVFQGRRKARAHPRTVEESDILQEWQDGVVHVSPQISTSFMGTESNKMALAMCLEDDGNGRNPGELVNGQEGASKTEEARVRSKFFLGMKDAYYKALLMGLFHIETLINEACDEPIRGESTDEEDQILAELICSSDPDVEVTGEIKILHGLATLTFASPPTDAIDEANALAEDMLQSDRESITEGRARFVIATARLAAHFRGDGKRKFAADSTLVERMRYIMSLPLRLYYVYLAAGNAWQSRVNRASDVSLVGNF